MPVRSEQLQIRLTRAEKLRLKRLARAAGQDLSAYVLSRALPAAAERLAGLVGMLRDESDRRFALAELNDALSSLSVSDFVAAVGTLDVRPLPPLMQNYVAAMIEQAASEKHVRAPAWTHDVEPLEQPWFATPLRKLRLHLLRAAPVPFKRRNIFIDAGLGARV
jgi:uncharacterized protein (DUF1778 family)